MTESKIFCKLRNCNGILQLRESLLQQRSLFFSMHLAKARCRSCHVWPADVLADCNTFKVKREEAECAHVARLLLHPYPLCVFVFRSQFL